MQFLSSLLLRAQRFNVSGFIEQTLVMKKESDGHLSLWPSRSDGEKHEIGEYDLFKVTTEREGIEAIFGGDVLS